MKLSSEEKRVEPDVGAPTRVSIQRASIDNTALGKQVDDKRNDDALAFAAEHHVGSLTAEEDKLMLWKIDRVLLPIVSCLILHFSRSTDNLARYDLQPEVPGPAGYVIFI